MKWVLIDLGYIAYRAQYTMGNLEHEDIPTGVMFGFFEQLYSICNHPLVRSNKVLVFADSKKSYRLRAFPGYKLKRKEQRTEEEKKQRRIMYKQINKLKNKILPRLGFPVFKQVGIESDDLIAYAAQEITKRKEYGIMICNDYDMYQCITPYIQWNDPSRELLVNEDTFRDKKGIEPQQWGTVKAIGGCTSDSVPGLKGVGEKGAIKWLKGQLPEHLKQFKTITENLKEVKKWGKLTILPHKKTKPFDIQLPEYNIKSFFSFCKKYNIMSYLESPKRSQWIKFFKGKFKGKIKRRKIKRRKLV